MTQSARSTKSLVAQNTFTDAIFIRHDNKATITVAGTYAGTITAQVSIDGGETWIDVDDVTADEEGRWELSGGGDQWRAGFKTSGYGSGTAVVTVSGAKPNTN